MGMGIPLFGVMFLLEHNFRKCWLYCQSIQLWTHDNWFVSGLLMIFALKMLSVFLSQLRLLLDVMILHVLSVCIWKYFNCVVVGFLSTKVEEIRKQFKNNLFRAILSYNLLIPWLIYHYMRNNNTHKYSYIERELDSVENPLQWLVSFVTKYENEADIRDNYHHITEAAQLAMAKRVGFLKYYETEIYEGIKGDNPTELEVCREYMQLYLFTHYL